MRKEMGPVLKASAKLLARFEDAKIHIDAHAGRWWMGVVGMVCDCGQGLDWNLFPCSLGGQDIKCLDMGCDRSYDSSGIQVPLPLDKMARQPAGFYENTNFYSMFHGVYCIYPLVIQHSHGKWPIYRWFTCLPI